VAKKITKKKSLSSLLDIPRSQLRASRSLACQIARLAHDRHCRDVVVMDLVHLSPVARYFVIGTGTSQQQIRSVAAEITHLARESDYPVFGKSGVQRGRWVAVDFVDIIVHLFDEEYRRYYDLELLWGDAPRVNWQKSPRPKN